MIKVVYEVVEHDGGWAYKFNKVFSETFPTHAAAHAAAEKAAAEQRVPGKTEEIQFEDSKGKSRYSDIKTQILTRLRALLGDPIMVRLLSATETRLDLAHSMRAIADSW